MYPYIYISKDRNGYGYMFTWIDKIYTDNGYAKYSWALDAAMRLLRLLQKQEEPTQGKDS